MSYHPSMPRTSRLLLWTAGGTVPSPAAECNRSYLIMRSQMTTGEAQIAGRLAYQQRRRQRQR